jgi:hypothetical protein
VEGSLSDTEYRNVDGATGSVKSSVIKTGYDNGINVIKARDLGQETRKTHGDIMKALNTGWAVLGICRNDLSAWPRHSARGNRSLFGH